MYYKRFDQLATRLYIFSLTNDEDRRVARYIKARYDQCMIENKIQTYKDLEKSSNTKKLIYRWILFIILGIFALYYITPLYVMIVTSFKTMEEIRQGNLFSLPSSLDLSSWDVAWSGQGFSAGDVYLKTYFWNSVKLVVPGVIISTILGAINGYALTKWRFKGDSYIFLLFLFGTFIPYQAILLPMSRTLGFLGISNSIYGLILYLEKNPEFLTYHQYTFNPDELFFQTAFLTFPRGALLRLVLRGALSLPLRSGFKL